MRVTAVEKGNWNLRRKFRSFRKLLERGCRTRARPAFTLVQLAEVFSIVQTGIDPVSFAPRRPEEFGVAYGLRMAQHLILVVDDVAATRNGLLELLRLKGFDARGAESAEDALLFIVDQPRTRLVILDLNMPGAGGLWFRREQLSNPAVAHIPVAVFTGGELPAESFGFCARLKKPFSVDELLRIIEAHCEDNDRISA